MASRVDKDKTNNRWRFSFYSTSQAKEGYPARKWFYFPADTFTKTQVRRIRDHYVHLYRAGRWNPWKDPQPSLAPQGSTPADAPSTIQSAVDMYLEELHRELAQSTVDRTSTHLGLLCKQYGQLAPAQITGRQASAFINAYENYNSRRTVDYDIRRFFGWMARCGYIPQPPDITMTATRAEKKPAERPTITEKELRYLLDGFDQLFDKRSQSPYTDAARLRQVYTRHKDMTIVLFYMGLRMSDIIHCRPAWLLDECRLMRIGDLRRWGLPDEYHPKSQLETDPPIAVPPQARKVLRRRAGALTDRYEPLFNLTHPRRYQEPFKQAVTLAFGKDFANSFTPHGLRHSCATFWLNEKGVPVQEVQRLLRHADIKMTMQYYHPDTGAHMDAFSGQKGGYSE